MKTPKEYSNKLIKNHHEKISKSTTAKTIKKAINNSIIDVNNTIEAILTLHNSGETKPAITYYNEVLTILKTKI